MKTLTVGISDMKVSSDPDTYIVTHSLGSCIGLIAYDPYTHAGGLLHLQLPDSKGHERRSAENPFMFADTGIPMFLERLYRLRANRNNLIVSMFGGATMLNDDQIFKIGIKNARATKKILWQQALTLRHEDVGGNSSRTVGLMLQDGAITVKKNGQVFQLGQ